ncbi:MAG: hypothetical protein KKF50_05545 [Nanoarchaeota archaeon]|nr:hypothetical protein [Nanoarchaeota archaeon]
MVDRWKTSDTVWLVVLVFGGLFWLSTLGNSSRIDGSITGNVIYENNISDEDPFSDTSEMHWDHMPLTWAYETTDRKYDSPCNQDWFNRKINEALDFITNETLGAVTFEKNSSSTPDIFFVCDTELQPFRGDGYETIAEAFISYYEGSNIYAPGEVVLYDPTVCENALPGPLIHEVLHLLGLEHPMGEDFWDACGGKKWCNYNNKTIYLDEYRWDVMAPMVRECDARTSDKDKEYLIGIY